MLRRSRHCSAKEPMSTQRLRTARPRLGRRRLAPIWRSVRELLAKGAEVNSSANDGSTPLMAASFSGHADVVHALVAAKASVNAKTNTGRTALMFAATNGNLGAVRELLAAGADINAKADNGATALMLAANSNWPGVPGVVIARLQQALM